MYTGYFANYHYPYRRSKVHIVVDNKPICNHVVSKQSEFQWCTSYIYPAYIECKSCIEIAKNMRVPGIYKFE